MQSLQHAVRNEVLSNDTLTWKRDANMLSEKCRFKKAQKCFRL